MPTLAHYSNAASDVFPGGSVVFDVVFETYVNSGQACNASGVTIGITPSGAPDSGTGTPVATTGTGVSQLGEGLFTYTWNPAASITPGSYLVTWTGTRASDSTTVSYQQAVNVAANPEATPLPGVYASVAQFRAWSGDTWTPAQRITVALQRATEQMDVALVAAVYRVDADGMPLDPMLANVLVRATSAQTQYILAVNDDANVKREYASTSVGGVAAVRSAKMQGLAMPPIAPQALAILRVAGVLPSAPLVAWLRSVVTPAPQRSPSHDPQRVTPNQLTRCGAENGSHPVHRQPRPAGQHRAVQPGHL